MIYQIIEAIFSFSMFVNAALFVPQALKVFREGNAHSLSLITFGGFNLIQLAFVLHGWMHSDWLLVIGMGLSLVTCGLVTLQIIYSKFFQKSS